MSETIRDAAVDSALGLIRGMNPDQLKLLSARLLAELSGASAEQMDRNELRRRCAILAARAEETRQTSNYGKLLCPVCGQPKAQTSLARHLQHRHPDEVSQMPAEQFGRPGPRVSG